MAMSDGDNYHYNIDLIVFRASLLGLRCFFVVTVAIVLAHRKKQKSGGGSRSWGGGAADLFFDPNGRSHRLAGGFHLLWLLYGCFFSLATPMLAAGDSNNTFWPSNEGDGRGSTSISPESHSPSLLIYDVVLGIAGIAATLTAAKDFPHRRVKNRVGQSGTLSKVAIVTQSEMIEHSFYQFLNLWQALYLHFSYHHVTSSALHGQTNGIIQWNFWFKRWLALLVVTAPWWIRRRYFPVHSFSDNWTKKKMEESSSKADEKTGDRTNNSHRLENLLYRIKKTQYLFYKHVVLHGINISVCLQQEQGHVFDVTSPYWRLFWLCLNTSYVMEFFLQSMVKREVMSQSAMLWLNRLLMMVSSLAAIPAIFGGGDNNRVVQWHLCLGSFILNVVQRYHDVQNTMVIATVAILLFMLQQQHHW